MTPIVRRTISASAVLLILAGLAGVLIYAFYYDRAFPEASVDLRVGRVQAIHIARDFAKEQRWNTRGMHVTAIFDYDGDAKAYLEQTLGAERANRLMANQVPMWYWRVRICRPLDAEEYRVDVDPRGKIIRYRHTIPEDAPGARLTSDQARAIAESGLRHRSGSARHPTPIGLRSNPADTPHPFLELVSATANRLPHRTDHTFIWRAKGVRYGRAELRFGVTVRGDRVEGYRESLHIPEAWLRAYSTEQSKGDTAKSAATIAALALLIAVAWIAFRLPTAPRAAVRLAGIAALLYAVVSLLDAINGYPQALTNFDTTQELGTYIVHYVNHSVIGALAFGFVIAILAVAGETVYARVPQRAINIGSLISRRGLRSRPFLRCVGVGYALAAAHLGYVILFYLIGLRHGVWSPLDTGYDNSLGTWMPWLAALSGGIQAALLEELGFRYFAINLLRRYVPWRWVAVVIPAVVWAFLHSDYPQQPFYTRGIELTVVGIAYGYVMLRYGVLATIVAHYTYNAFLGAHPLLISGRPGLVASGVIVTVAMLLPAIPPIVRRMRGKAMVEAWDLYEAKAPNVEPPPPRPRVAKESDWVRPPSGRGAAIGLALVGLLGCAVAVGLRPQRLGDFVKIGVDRQDAQGRALHYARSIGIDPHRFRLVTSFGSELSGSDIDYVKQKVGVRRANRIFSRDNPRVWWCTRLYNPGQVEEYNIYLRPDGAVLSYYHMLPETAPGANLTTAQATAIAENELRRRGIDLAEWSLITPGLTKRDARTDYHFQWQKRSWHVGRSRLQMSLTVQGSEVFGYSTRLVVPEEWVRARARTPVRKAAARAIFLWLALPFCMYMAARAYAGWTDNKTPIRSAIIPGCLVAGAWLLSTLNTIPAQFSGYDTTTPVAAYVLRFIAVLLLPAVPLFFIPYVIMRFTHACDSESGTRGRMTRSWGTGAAFGLAGIGIWRLGEWVMVRYHWGSAMPWQPTMGIDGIAPCLGALGFAVTIAGVTGFLWVMGLALVRSAGWRAYWIEIAVLAIGAIAALGAVTSAAGALSYLVRCVGIVLVIRLGRWLLGSDYWAYVAAIVSAAMVTESMAIVRSSDPWLHANGIAVLAMAAAPIILALWTRIGRKAAPMSGN